MKTNMHFFAAVLFTAITVLLALPAQAQQSGGSPLADQPWVRLGGPIGGLGYDIRMRPDNPDIMYVTDAWAGVHKSTDGGMTWFTLNNGIDARTGSSGDAIPVFCLTIDPNNHDLVWIGLQDLGAVYRSDDGGQTWQKRTNGIVEGNGLTFRGITVESGNSDVVYAAGEISSFRWNNGKELWGREFDRTRGVVYKSTDGGGHWQAVWRGDNLARYIWIDPNDHNILYVSTGIFDREAANSDFATNTAGGEGVLKSTDGGETWTNINNGLGNLYVGSLFMHPQNSNILLAGTGNNAYRAGGGVYLTTDGGTSWKHVTGEHVTSVEFALSDPNIAYAAGAGYFYRSEDGGKTWKTLENELGWWGPAGIRPGFPIDFQVDPRDPDRIFVNNYGGGNFLSEDGGETWVSASVGYTGADLRDVFVFPTNPAFVLVNGRSGPFLSHDGGVNWEGINPLEIRPIAEGARVVVDPSNQAHILLSSSHQGWTFESLDGGLNWYLATNYENELNNLPVLHTGDKFQGVQALAFAPSNPNIVYAGFGLWRKATSPNPDQLMSILISEDGGHSWTQLNAGPLEGWTVAAFLVHPTNLDIAWASTLGGGIFRTQDRGITWEAVNQGLDSLVIMGLAGDPTNPDTLYAGANDRGVFKSVNGGGSWNAMSAGMDPNEPVNAVVVDPLRPNVVYAGSNRSGVFVSEDGGSRWRLINDGLRTRAINTLSISADGETLYAGTSGEGVFRLSTHNQAYFDSLVPTPTAIPPTPTAIPPTPNPTIKPSIQPTSTPTPGTPQLALPCGGAAIVPLGLILLPQWRRKLRK